MPADQLGWWVEESERVIDEVLGDVFEKRALPSGAFEWVRGPTRDS